MSNYQWIVAGLIIIVIGLSVIFFPPIFEFVSNKILAVIMIIIGCFIIIPAGIANR